MSVRRTILFSCLILAVLAVAAGITRAPRTAGTPIPLATGIADLHLMGIDGLVPINEKNQVCYTINAFGQKRHGEITGVDFNALRDAGKEDTINQIFTDRVNVELEAINSSLGMNESLPLLGDAAYAQMMCEDCGGGCGMWTVGGVYDTGYPPPYPCACYWGAVQCAYVFYHCGQPNSCP